MASQVMKTSVGTGQLADGYMTTAESGPEQRLPRPSVLSKSDHRLRCVHTLHAASLTSHFERYVPPLMKYFLLIGDPHLRHSTKPCLAEGITWMLPRRKIHRKK